jgi:hypothetical protein
MTDPKRSYPRRNRQGVLLKNESHEAAVNFAQKNLFVRRLWEQARRPFWQIINKRHSHAT